MARSPAVITQVLEEAGIKFVFGVPGGGTGQLYNALYDRRDTIRTILVRHEQVAAIMADAYARATGAPCAIMGQGVFMGSNASFGVMEAQTSSVPMIVFADTFDDNLPQHPANQSGAGEYGSIDLPAMMRAMTKYTTVAASPKEAVIGTQLAIKHALTGRQGPAAVVLRSASLGGEVDLESPPFLYPTQGYLNTTRPQAPPDEVARVAGILAGARSPVIVAGHGVRMARGSEALEALADQLAIPVATTFKGKSALAETHDLALGMLGVFGQRVANAVVGQADVVLIAGAKMTPLDTIRELPDLIDPKRQTIIQIDIDSRNAGWTFPVEVGLVGDAKEILEQLGAAVPALSAEQQETVARRRRRIVELKNELEYHEGEPAAERESAPVMPQRLVRVLEQTLDPRSLITLDAGNNRTWVCRYFRSRERDTFFAPGGMQGMGWGLPAALGLKLARPNRPVVNVSGDGGFMMNITGLSTAVQHEIPVVCVVMNDSALGMVYQGQRKGGRVIASQFADTDFAALARAFGAEGYRIDDSRDLPDAIREAQASNRPVVIDVITDQTASTAELRADRRDYVMV